MEMSLSFLLKILLIVYIAKASKQEELVITKPSVVSGYLRSNQTQIPGIEDVNLITVAHLAIDTQKDEKIAQIRYESLRVDILPNMKLRPKSGEFPDRELPYFYIKGEYLHAKYSGMKMFTGNISEVGFYITFSGSSGTDEVRNKVHFN